MFSPFGVVKPICIANFKFIFFLLSKPLHRQSVPSIVIFSYTFYVFVFILAVNLTLLDRVCLKRLTNAIIILGKYRKTCCKGLKAKKCLNFLLNREHSHINYTQIGIPSLPTKNFLWTKTKINGFPLLHHKQKYHTKFYTKSTM